MPNTDNQNIHPAFASHRLTAEAADAVTGIKLAYTQLLSVIEHNIPSSRERSVAITDLQTSCMWAVRAVSVDPKNHYVDYIPGMGFVNIQSGSPE